MDSTPAIRDHLCGHQFKCDDDQHGYNDGIVKMADDWDKVGNEVEGQQRISDGEPEQPLGRLRRPGVFEHKLIDLQLALERSSDSFQIVKQRVSLEKLEPVNE